VRRASKLLPPAALFAYLVAAGGCGPFLESVLVSDLAESRAKQERSAHEEASRRRAEERAEEREAEKQRRAEEEAAREKAAFDAIDLKRKEIAAAREPGVLAQDFARLVLDAQKTAGARSGKVDMSPLVAEAAKYLEASLRKSPSLEAFDLLTSLPATDDTDRAIVAACPRVRPLLPPGGVVEFTSTCLDSAGGDAKKLAWPSARKDLAELAKVEGERRAAEAQALREAAKNARYVAAAVFASGRCSFNNCMKEGWTAETPEGNVTVRCSFSNCLTDGWTASFPDGTEARTRCSFSDCMKDGWTTSFADGTEARTRCSFSNCLKDGWTTDLPGGGSATTRCSFGDCAKEGWETSLPDGNSVRCRCNFSKCFEDGATCG